MLKVLAVVVAFGVVVAGVLVYLVGSAAVASGRARSDSIALLESVRTRANDAQAALKALPPFDVSSTSPDFAKAKQTADQYSGQLGGFRTTVQSDEAKLREDRDRLMNQATGVWELPFRPSLDHERLRAEGLLSALQAEDTALGIEQDQMKALSALFDAVGAFTGLGADQNQDVASLLAKFPALDAKLKTAAQATSGQNMPPQLPKLVASLQTLSTDLSTTLVAAQRGDRRTVQSMQSKVDADVVDLGSFDSKGFDTYEQTLLQPYMDRFDAGVRAAGFTPQQLT